LLHHPHPQRQRVRFATTPERLAAPRAGAHAAATSASCLPSAHLRLSFLLSAVSGEGGDGAR
jgi:hypothetical protein